MGIRITHAHKDVRTSVAADPNEFFSKIQKQFGGFPVTLSNADLAICTTIKNAATTAAPFATIITLIQSGFNVTIEPSTPQ